MLEISNIGVVTVFVAGLVSFLSPCVLPLVPGYISFVGDGTALLAIYSTGLGVPFLIAALFTHQFVGYFKKDTWLHPHTSIRCRSTINPYRHSYDNRLLERYGLVAATSVSAAWRDWVKPMNTVIIRIPEFNYLQDQYYKRVVLAKPQ